MSILISPCGIARPCFEKAGVFRGLKCVTRAGRPTGPVSRRSIRTHVCHGVCLTGSVITTCRSERSDHGVCLTGSVITTCRSEGRDCFISRRTRNVCFFKEVHVFTVIQRVTLTKNHSRNGELASGTSRSTLSD